MRVRKVSRVGIFSKENKRNLGIEFAFGPVQPHSRQIPEAPFRFLGQGMRKASSPGRKP